ncbi:uncharacterized protein LOC118801818 [Colossoma macropomum]|uniref:uncharacterized protein LOC118801818 n=1 Tax=Colossoma macropomum TaxID=42526 RepID=UPI001864FBB7|nr:uncharacterized protein LOC118801818 [Colossoma macropomum]
MNDAEVVCRQMGCGRAVSAPQNATFGQGGEPTWLDNVGCRGTESYITECSHNGFGVENCGHNKDAGVVCSNILQSPTFTLTSSHSAVSPGEAVQFRCTNLNPTCISANFSLYKNGESIKTQTAESSVTFNLTVDSSHQGQYSCDYSYHGNNIITSPRSSLINITVVNLLQPTISFSALDGWFHWWLQGSEVTRGHSFSVSCSTQPQYPGGSFYLEFSGSRTGTQPAVNHSTTFLFPEADFVHQGDYSCVYEVTVSSRIFNSPTTELLDVTVKESPIPFIGSGVAAGLLLILVPIIVFFTKRCKKQKGQMAVKTDHRVCAKNTYGTARGKNEVDYENAETIFRQREDSDNCDVDYVNMEGNVGKMALDNDFAGNKMDDDKNDYENAAVTVHQREDSDDPDEGYIDVQKMAMDIHFDDENIL